MTAWRDLPEEDRAVVLEWLRLRAQYHREEVIGVQGEPRRWLQRRVRATESAIAALEEAARGQCGKINEPT